jgi:hypothetical protein
VLGPGSQQSAWSQTMVSSVARKLSGSLEAMFLSGY